MFETSATVGELAKALAAAQGEMTAIAREKTADMEQYQYKYADLADVLDGCRPQLSKNGIAIVQSPYTDDDGAIGIATCLMHSSGEWMRGQIAHSMKLTKWQDLGGALTYLRRYALGAMVGVASEDDSDAAELKTKRQPRKREEPEPEKPPTGAQKAEKIAHAIKAAATSESVDKTLQVFSGDLQWLHDHMEPYWNRLQVVAEERKQELADLAANPPYENVLAAG